MIIFHTLVKDNNTSNDPNKIDIGTLKIKLEPIDDVDMGEDLIFSLLCSASS